MRLRTKWFDLNQTDWRPRYFQLGLLYLLMVLLRFGWMLALGRTLFFGDNYSLLIPGKIFTAYWISQGIIPLWNPYIFSGLTWIGDISQSLFYPSTLLFMSLHPATAVNITVILQLGLALLGMYWLAHVWTSGHRTSLLGALLWSLSTQVTGSINNLATIQSIVWLPWLVAVGLWIGKKTWAIPAFALLVFLQLAGGYPLHSFFGVGLAVVVSGYWSWGSFSGWQWLKAWLITGLATVGLAAVLWLPFVEAALSSTRMWQSNVQASRGSLNPAMLLKPILPYVFDKPTAGMKWGPAWSEHPNVMFYVTWMGSLAILTGLVRTAKDLWAHRRLNLANDATKDRVFFSLLGLTTLLFAMGSYLPGFELLQQLVPLFRIARYPSLILMITNLIIALWVAVELPQLKLSLKTQRILIVGAVLLVISSLISWWLVRNHFEVIWTQIDAVLGGGLSSSVFHTFERDQVIAQVIVTNVIVVAGLAAASLWALFQKRWWLVLLLVMADLLYNTAGYLFFVPRSVYPAEPQLQAVMMPLVDPQARVLLRNSNHPYTAFDSYWEAMVVRSPFSDSFVDRYELITGQHAINLRDGLTPDWNMVYQIPAVQGYSTLLPQDYASLWEDPTSEEVGINFIDQVNVFNPLLSQWAAKYYVVDTWFKVEEDYSLYPVVAQNERWTIYQLPALSRFRYGDDQAAELVSVTETPNQIELAINNQANQTSLRVADRFEANWRAEVNGQPVVVENYQGMRQIPIQPGNNKILFKYVPRLFYAGAVVSLISAGALVVGYWWAKPRRHL